MKKYYKAIQSDEVIRVEFDEGGFVQLTEFVVFEEEHYEPEETVVEEKPQPKIKKPVTKAPGARGPRICKSCGQPGHTAKTCTRSEIPALDTKSEKVIKIDRTTFAEVRSLMTQEGSSAVVAEQMNLPLSTVNKIVAADSFYQYKNQV